MHTKFKEKENIFLLNTDNFLYIIENSITAGLFNLQLQAFKQYRWFRITSSTYHLVTSRINPFLDSPKRARKKKSRIEQYVVEINLLLPQSMTVNYYKLNSNFSWELSSKLNSFYLYMYAAHKLGDFLHFSLLEVTALIILLFLFLTRLWQSSINCIIRQSIARTWQNQSCLQDKMWIHADYLTYS